MFSVRFQMALKGNLKQYEQGIARANTSAIRSVTANFKRQARRSIERAGLGKRLPLSLRSEVRSPSGADLTRRGSDPFPIGRAWSKAIVERNGKKTDLLGEVFETGVTIQGNPFLAIGTPAAGGRRAPSPSSFPEGTFARVPLQRGRGRLKANTAQFLLVHRELKEVWYVLIPTVKLKRRLRLYARAARVAQTIPTALERSYRRLFTALRKAA